MGAQGKPVTRGDYRLRDVKCREDWANFEDMRAAERRVRGPVGCTDSP
jgi:hypothetical protein